jgi:hypothetical protein
MLHLNDDNDELLRRAAEEYPLNTGTPDWDAFRKKLDTYTPEAPVRTNSRKKLFSLLLLILLFPLGIMFNQYVMNRKGAAGKTQGTQAALVQRNSEAVPLNKTTRPGDPAKTAAGTVSAATDNHSSGDVVVTKNERQEINDRQQDHFAGQPENGYRPVRYKTKAAAKMRISASAAEADDNAGAAAANGLASADPITVTNEITPATPSEDVAVTEKIVESKKDKDKENGPAGDPVKPAKKGKQRSTHFYAGVLGGPDLTAVKLQSMKKLGTSLGFIAGYRLTQKLSVETGLLWDKKNYYTAGEYFSRKKLPISSTVIIEAVDGQCRMLELPLNLRYDIKQAANHTWFAAMGLSSYFMKNEQYAYDINYSGYRAKRSYSYNKKSADFFSVINLSGGYSRRIGKIGELRVEPYVKIPVKKIGTGSLPLQSGGVYIGFTKNLF